MSRTVEVLHEGLDFGEGPRWHDDRLWVSDFFAHRVSNGSVVTPDGGTLVVGESMGGRYTAFAIGDDGTLTDRRVWAAVPGKAPDGQTLHLITAPAFGEAVCAGLGLGKVEVVEVDAPGAGWP